MQLQHAVHHVDGGLNASGTKAAPAKGEKQ